MCLKLSIVAIKCYHQSEIIVISTSYDFKVLFFCDSYSGVLVVYNNLIPHEELSSTSGDYKKIAIGVRIIDISTGDIVDVNELTNLNVQEEEPVITTEEVEDESGEQENDQEDTDQEEN